jgi:hypothetical protein
MSLAAVLFLQEEKSIAEEGRDIILVMLAVGLIFVSVIALGQLSRWYGHKRAAERRRRRRVY